MRATGRLECIDLQIIYKYDTNTLYVHLHIYNYHKIPPAVLGGRPAPVAKYTPAHVSPHSWSLWHLSITYPLWGSYTFGVCPTLRDILCVFYFTHQVTSTLNLIFVNLYF